MDECKQLLDSGADVFSKFLSLGRLILLQGKMVTDLIDYSNGNQSQLSKTTLRPIREVDGFLMELSTAFKKRNKPKLVTDMIKSPSKFISTGLHTLDSDLGGGIPTGEITEIFGSSGCGKSHMLAQLAMECQLNEGDCKECIHIGTESFLETKRLHQIQQSYELKGSTVSLDNISYIYCQDLESQDHIIYTQLPIHLELKAGKVRLLVIDSIAQHLRREGSLSNSMYLEERIKQQEKDLKDCEDYQSIRLKQENNLKRFQKSTKYRNRMTKQHYLYLLHRHLQKLAKKYNIAVVVVNQVSDHASTYPLGGIFEDEINNPLNLNFQLGIHSGWDVKTLYSLQKQRKVFVNEREADIMEAELVKSINELPVKKRIVENELNLDMKHQRRENNDIKYNKQKELLFKLHKLRNLETKKVIPTLGYQWSCRMSIRIMLMKTYRPLMKSREQLEIENSEVVHPDSDLTYEKLCEGFSLVDSQINTDSQIESRKRNYSSLNGQRTIETSISGWEVERYAKVVYSSYSPIISGNSKIHFVIDKNGLHENI